MNYNDKDYFDRKLRLNNTYRLRNFYCESKGAGQRVIATPVSLRFRRNVIVDDVPPTDFPEHCFSFTAANRLSTHVSRNTLLVGMPYVPKENYNCANNILHKIAI